MIVKNLIVSQLIDSYNGEIFVKANNAAVFNAIKSFIDANNLICFIESENKIYAQGHEYTGITASQANQIEKITNLETSISGILDKLELANTGASIIGALTYTVNEDGQQYQVQAPNVTSYVETMINAVQAGESSIAQQINNLESTINDLEDLLSGFPVTSGGQEQNVKDYIDNQLTTAVTQLALAIANNATLVTGDNEHITVTYEATIDQVDLETGLPISYKPPYTFKVSGYDIASESSLNELIARINSLFGPQGNNKSIQTIIDEEIAAKLIPEQAQESLDTLQEIANWIQDHPNDVAQINSAITNINNSLSELQQDWDDNKDLFALKGELYEPDGEGGYRLKTTVNGQTYGTTLEEINILLGQMSYAQNVEDNAEQNVIVDIATNYQSIDINGTTVEYDDGEGGTTDSAQLIQASYDSINRTILLGLNTDALEQILNTTIDVAETSAVSQANAYTDSRLSWINIDQT